MCGISGIINKKGWSIEKDEIVNLTNGMKHRGPDGEGYFLHKNVALGHRRLSLIDLKGGSQPISNEDNSIWIVFNGEIYNYIELRGELIVSGHKFKTNSDTEVIIHAYEQWGTDCVKRFRGMFSFAILDEKKERIFLSRDHFGIKPLVYYQNDEIFAFASEIQGIKQLRNISLSMNLESIDNYLWFQYIPAPASIFNEITKLEPATSILVNFKGQIFWKELYWEANFRPDLGKKEVGFIHEINEALKASVRAHLMSEVPFGAFLSGGIDSTLVVKYMSEIMDSPVKTFSIIFDDNEFNEEEYALTASQKYKTDHQSIKVKPNAIEILPKLVNHYGEPFGDSSSLPTYYVSNAARQQVTMVLSGDGSDEIFGGYQSYSHWLNKLNMKMNLWDKLFGKSNQNLENWISSIEYMQYPMRKSLWKENFSYISNNVSETFSYFFNKANRFSALNRVQYMDINTYMPYDILTKVDISSMANSLEVRTPFIDVDLYSLALTIPEKLNYKFDSAGNYHGKLLLKKILETDFNHDFVYRKKQGFATPLSKWFSSGGDLEAYTYEKLLSKNSIISIIFNVEVIKNILDRKIDGLIWLLLVLEEWMSLNQKFIRIK